MKKLLSNLCSFVFLATALCIGFFSNNIFSQKIVKAENTTPTVFTDVAITQEGYIFGIQDFDVQDSTNYLYVNTAITINKISASLPIEVLIYKDNTLSETKILSSSGDYTVLNYDQTTETVSKIVLQQKSNTSAIVSQFTFNLIQTPNHFYINPTYYWTGSNNEIISAPSLASAYKSLVLNNFIGTKNCPLYLDFYYNGALFQIYTDNNTQTYYNASTGNKLSNEQLIFNQAGEYTVNIYDKTYLTGSKFANKKSYQFKIYSGTSSNIPNIADLYIIARNTSGDSIVNTQKVNDAVNLNFYNLSSQLVDTVKISIYHETITGERVLEEIIRTDIEKLKSETLSFTADNDYVISLIRNSTEVYNYSFSIYTEVHSGHKNIQSDDLERENVIYNIDFSENISITYKGFSEIISTSDNGQVQYSELKNTNTYHYSVKIAKANTRLTGIDNNSNSNEPVSLTVHGVGNIKVTVTKDGATNTYTLTDGQTVPNTSEVGSYTVSIVDQMGFIANRSFKISKPLNSATIILIVAIIVPLVLLVFAIIKTRTNLKVR